MFSSFKCLAIATLSLFLASAADAYEIGLRYYKVRDHAVAEKLHDIDDAYDEREDPLKQQRRNAGYNTPEHAEATRQLEILRQQRDREFLDLLEDTPPEVDYRANADAGETIRESTTVNGNDLHVEIGLGQPDGDKIPVEIDAEYDGTTLYKGTALLIPVSVPYVVSKAFIKIQGKRQANLIFIEVRP